jgi:hypothetical protein
MDRPEQPPIGYAQHETPPFWIAKSRNGVVRVDERVHAEASRLWPWCHGLVSTRLRDGAVAAQMLDEVAVKVSIRLQQEERVADHLRGYLIRSFVRRVNAAVRKDRRLQCRGLARDLESILSPVAPEWVRDIEERLVIDAIAACLDADAQRMLNFRRLGFSWKLIAKQFGNSENQVRQAFYYQLRQAAWALFGLPDRKEDLS